MRLLFRLTRPLMAWDNRASSVFIPQQAFPVASFVLGPAEWKMQVVTRKLTQGWRGRAPSPAWPHTPKNCAASHLLLRLTEGPASGGPAPRAVGAWGLPGSPAAPSLAMPWAPHSHAVCHSQPLRGPSPSQWSDCKTLETPGKNHRAGAQLRHK